MKLLKTSVLALLVPLVLVGAAPERGVASAVYPRNVEESFTLCKRPDGSIPSTVDLLLLFDNSRSLNSTLNDNVPSDPEGARFVAVEEMLTEIGSAISNTKAQVNFGLIKFGTKATTLIPLGDEQITQSSAPRISSRIRELLPPDRAKQENATDYIKALDAARTEFRKSNSAHCRVLIWFTDGVFDYGDGDKKRNSEKLDELRRETCDVAGWPAEFRELRVNSFVVLLQKGRPTDRVSYQASQELMQALTGDPDFEPKGCSRSPGFPFRHVGQVFTGSNAKDLGPLFKGIGIEIGGGKVLACSSEGETLTTGMMPSGKFLKFVELISRSGTALPPKSQIMVIGRGGIVQQLSTQMTKTDESTTSIRWVPKAESALDAGWQLKIEGSTSGFCLYGALVDPVSVLLKRVADAPVSVTQVGKSTLGPGDLSQIRYSDGPDGPSLTAAQVLDLFNQGKSEGITPDIRASLVVDATGVIFPEQLMINVQIEDPIPDIRSCTEMLSFNSPSLVGNMPRDSASRTFQSTSCTISTKGTTTTVTVSAEKFFDALTNTQGCEGVSPALVFGDQPQKDGKGVISAEQTSSVFLTVEMTGRKSDCKIRSDDGVTATFTLPDGNPKNVPIAVTLRSKLSPAPSPWWVMFGTLLAVIVAALLSLVLLRLMNSWLARLPETQGLFSYELEITIDYDSHQFVTGKVDGVTIDAYQPQARDLRPVTAGTSSEMQLQSTQIERKLPGLFKPFQEASAMVVGDDTAAYWQQTPSGGLVIPFSTAVIVQRSKKNTPTAGVGALLTIVVPRNGADSGIAGVEKILKGSKLSDLLKKFRTEMVETNSQGQSNNGAAGESSPAPGGGPKPPPPPVPR